MVSCIIFIVVILLPPVTHSVTVSQKDDDDDDFIYENPQLECLYTSTAPIFSHGVKTD